MPDCIFCKIVKKEVPSLVIYEDKDVFAFLDIGPVNPGHTLVIPKKHAKNLYEIKDPDLAKVSVALKKVASAVKSGVGSEGINIMMNVEKAAGQLVDHIHFHVIPRFSNDGIKHWPHAKYLSGQAEAVQKK